MSLAPIYETSFTRSIKFWLLLICQTPSVICSLFVLYHMISSRKQRQLLANHVIITMLIVSFLTATIDLPIILSYLHEGALHPQSSSFCYFWMFIDYVFYANGMLLLAWASIERHILIFASRWFRSLYHQIFCHYIPIIICLIYPIIFYMYAIFFYSCDNKLDYKMYLCGFPCYKNSFFLTGYDDLMHAVIPSIIIVIFSLALLIRVIRQKRRVQGQLFSWRKQKRMVVQLLSLACLYIIMTTPPYTIAIAQACISKTFARTEYILYIIYLFYFLILFVPFICLGSIGDLRIKINFFLKIMKCPCLIKTTRIGVISDQRNGIILKRIITQPNMNVS